MRRRVDGALVALVVAIGLAACSRGDDDDSSASAATPPARRDDRAAGHRRFDRRTCSTILGAAAGRGHQGDVPSAATTPSRSRRTTASARSRHGTSMSIVTPARSVDCTDIDTKPVVPRSARRRQQPRERAAARLRQRRAGPRRGGRRGAADPDHDRDGRRAPSGVCRGRLGDVPARASPARSAAVRDQQVALCIDARPATCSSTRARDDPADKLDRDEGRRSRPRPTSNRPAPVQGFVSSRRPRGRARAAGRAGRPRRGRGAARIAEHVAGPALAEADLDERADDRAHHLPAERARRGSRSAARRRRGRATRLEHAAHRRRSLRTLAAERREVVLADERIGGEPQRAQVERLRDPPREAVAERIGHRPVDDRVAVPPPLRGVPRVERRGDELARPHDDLGAEHRR